MQNTSKTIIFFGSGPVAAESLKFIATRFNIEAVITKAVPVHHKAEAPVEVLARSLNLPIFFASTKRELDQVIKNNAFKSDLGIIIDYGVIVSETVIRTFPYGIINSHFSLLPQWRGADPITFSLLSGQAKTGVSLMVIDTGLDTGKLITRKLIPISPSDTTPSLTEKLINLSNSLLEEFVPKYWAGEIKAKHQPHPDRATYSRKLQKSDGILDFSKSAEVLEREIRAYTGWPRSRTEIYGHAVIVTQAHVSTNKNTPLDLRCGDGHYLSIDELIAPSGKRMSAAAFINGYAAG